MLCQLRRDVHMFIIVAVIGDAPSWIGEVATTRTSRRRPGRQCGNASWGWSFTRPLIAAHERADGLKGRWSEGTRKGRSGPTGFGPPRKRNRQNSTLLWRCICIYIIDFVEGVTVYYASTFCLAHRLCQYFPESFHKKQVLSLPLYK